MSGIRAGTRLQQLTALRARVHHAQASARGRHDPQEAATYTPLLHALDQAIADEQATTRRADATTRQLLAQAGVTANDVKRWAVTAGLAPTVRRGRVPRDLITAYQHAHQEQQ